MLNCCCASFVIWPKLLTVLALECCSHLPNALSAIPQRGALRSP